MFGVFGLFALLCLGLWIWALLDIVKSDFKDQNGKLIWCLLVIFLPFIGTILYFAIGKDQKVIK